VRLRRYSMRRRFSIGAPKRTRAVPFGFEFIRAPDAYFLSISVPAFSILLPDFSISSEAF